MTTRVVRRARGRAPLAGVAAIGMVFAGLAVPARAGATAATARPAAARVTSVGTATSSTTQPSSTSATSLYLSNWSNLQAIWMASHLNQNDTSTTYGPRIAELHMAGQWATNQIVDYSGFFIDTTSGTSYDQTNPFTSPAWLDSSGVLHTEYTAYNGQTMPFGLSRSYVMVPNEPFLVTRYRVTNPSTTTSLTVNLLDQVHLNNTQSTTNVTGSYDKTTSALYGDMTASQQAVVFLGALQAPGSYQVGNDANSNPASSTAGGWYQFNANGSLADNSSLATPNVDLGFQQSVTVGPGRTQYAYFYLGAAPSMSAAQSDVSAARGQSGAGWFQQSATDYASWLASGHQVNTSDGGVNTAYERSLVMMKDAQNPGTGLWPATTNPGSYGYKAWARDSAMTAMAMDAAGHYSTAAALWNWMATNQQANGTWLTTFDLWTGSSISFVQPEYDSAGMFLMGVYHHYQLTHSQAFLTAMWPAAQKAANFIMDNISSNGLGPADHSIWEQNLNYWTFTQAMYVAGLRAAAQLATVEADQAGADAWSGAATTIQTAVQTPYSASTPGLWNDTSGYYNEAQTTSGGPVTLIDASTNALYAFGALSPASGRAARDMFAVDTALGHLTHGLARYQGDTYYNTSPYSPAGNEAVKNEPVWPELTMWQAMYETYTHNSAAAFADLQWYASVSGVGYMAPGEAVSRATGQPVVSTMSEPLTAASFIMAALTYGGQYNPRVPAIETNQGAYASLTVTSNPAGDWQQWRHVPFASQDVPSVSGSTSTQVRRAYLANDASNLFVRADNGSGSLPAYGASPPFAVLIYSQDFAGSSVPSTTTGFYGGKLDHPMSYLAARWSNSNTFALFEANTSGGWSFVENLSSLAPQWDTATGRVEAAVPGSVFDSQGVTPPSGSIAYMEVELASQTSSGTWVDNSIMPVHYRWTAQGQLPLYGNTTGHELYWVSTSQGRYTPGQQVPITVDVVNPEVTPMSATLDLHFTHLGQAVGPDATAQVSLAPGQTQSYVFDWVAPTTDNQGYLVQVSLTAGNGQVLDSTQTAVDVSSTWNAFPRYGFVSNYGYQSHDTATWTMDLLSQYHLDALQFYDWQWKHHVPLAGTVSAPAASWNNVANVTNYRQTVLDLIAAAHAENMLAFNYNLLYGAWAGYGQDGSGVNYQWGLWWNNNCTNQVNVAMPSGWATPNIYVFDPGNASWQSYIDNRESQVFQAYPFDGWQVDQLGNEGAVYTCSGQQVHPTAQFLGFLQAAKKALGVHLIFNAVGNYGQSEVSGSGSPLDVTYTEAWPAYGQTTYNDLASTVNTDLADSGGHLQPVIAGYMDSSYGDSFSKANPGFFNTPGVLLTDAAIFASGGDHIELGGQSKMLSQPDFATQSLLMSGPLQQAMAREYNFATAYENVLSGSGLASSSHAIVLPGVPTSTTGAPGAVWTFSRSTTGMDVVQLVNLLGNSSSNWQDSNASYPAPPLQQNVVVKYYYGSGTVSGVTLASPDTGGGAAQALAFTTGSGSGGNYVQFTVPSLDYWDMVMVAKS
ncbi:MAG: glycoside hydrolase family 66 protein [Acidimicrobiales bacterium]